MMPPAIPPIHPHMAPVFISSSFPQNDTSLSSSSRNHPFRRAFRSRLICVKDTPRLRQVMARMRFLARFRLLGAIVCLHPLAGPVHVLRLHHPLHQSRGQGWLAQETVDGRLLAAEDSTLLLRIPFSARGEAPGATASARGSTHDGPQRTFTFVRQNMPGTPRHGAAGFPAAPPCSHRGIVAGPAPPGKARRAFHPFTCADTSSGT